MTTSSDASFSGTPGSGGCGCGAGGGVRIINVGGSPIGINRLDAIFSAVKAAVFGDETLERRELLRLAKASNYVPRGAEVAYEEALWREYSKINPRLHPRPKFGTR